MCGTNNYTHYTGNDTSNGRGQVTFDLYIALLVVEAAKFTIARSISTIQNGDLAS